MGKIYTAIGLMSGTSMDGVDASLIRSDGVGQLTNIFNEYYEFDLELHNKIVNLRNNISTITDLKNYSEELINLEQKITVFHGEIVNKILLKYKENIDLVGFHGQTIFHDRLNKITRQLGDGKLLSQLNKVKVVYNFRQNDLKNGGEGAPLTPIFHNLLSNMIYNKHNNEIFNILNIGGISNITLTIKDKSFFNPDIKAYDIGPGNCLIDEWIRKNSKKRYDENGMIGKSGKINELVLNQAIENFEISSFNNSLDIKDFDISFAKGLSFEDGCATLTNFTAYLIAEGIKICNKKNKDISSKYLVCGGGRKNYYLIECIKKYLKNFENITLDPIDMYNYDGDFIESQAFAYLAIRSYLSLPISFPSTTRCKKPISGGEIIKNF